MSPSPTPLPPRMVQVDVTSAHPSECCGRLPYSVNNGPWRCGCGKDVRDVHVPYVLGEAFEALLSLVVGNDRPKYDYMVSDEHAIVARLGQWRAGGGSMTEAREALKDVIRAALIEQTGDADAA